MSPPEATRDEVVPRSREYATCEAHGGGRSAAANDRSRRIRTAAAEETRSWAQTRLVERGLVVLVPRVHVRPSGEQHRRRLRGGAGRGALRGPAAARSCTAAGSQRHRGLPPARLLVAGPARLVQRGVPGAVPRVRPPAAAEQRDGRLSLPVERGVVQRHEALPVARLGGGARGDQAADHGGGAVGGGGGERRQAVLRSGRRTGVGAGLLGRRGLAVGRRRASSWASRGAPCARRRSAASIPPDMAAAWSAVWPVVCGTGGRRKGWVVARARGGGRRRLEQRRGQLRRGAGGARAHSRGGVQREASVDQELQDLCEQDESPSGFAWAPCWSRKKRKMRGQSRTGRCWYRVAEWSSVWPWSLTRAASSPASTLFSAWAKPSASPCRGHGGSWRRRVKLRCPRPWARGQQHIAHSHLYGYLSKIEQPTRQKRQADL